MMLNKQTADCFIVVICPKSTLEELQPDPLIIPCLLQWGNWTSWIVIQARKSKVDSLFFFYISPLESCLKVFNHPLVQLEGPCQEIRIDGWIWSKHWTGYGDYAWILAVKNGNGYCISVPNVDLEVNETEREHKNIPLVQDFANEAVFRVGCDKANKEFSLQDNEDLTGTRVKVRRVLTIRFIIDTRQWHPKSVFSW